MVLRLLPLVAAVLTLVSFTGVSHADLQTHESSQEAAAGAFEELLPEWNVVGVCDTSITPTPADVCYRFTPGRSTDEYSIYSAFAYNVTDTGWWAGVIETGGGWKVYDRGRCDLFYCRLADPAGEVLLGFPGGDANCDGRADSLDALIVLQVVAELPVGSLPCLAEADVFPRGGLDAFDALAILQSSAELTGSLPARDPDLA